MTTIVPAEVPSPVQRNKAVSAAIAVLALGGIAVWFYTAPYRTLTQIRQAAHERDTERLSELVDFPSVREHLKEQFNALLAQQLATSSEADKNNPFAAAGQAFGMMLARGMIDTLIDGLVSPSGIAAMSQGMRPDPRDPTKQPAPSTTVERKARFDSLSRFTVQFVDKREPETVLALHLRRYGFSWRLTSVDLPTLSAPPDSQAQSGHEPPPATTAERLAGAQPTPPPLLPIGAPESKPQASRQNPETPKHLPPNASKHRDQTPLPEPEVTTAGPARSRAETDETSTDANHSIEATAEETDSSGEPLRVGGDVSPPQLIDRIAPVYTESALRARVQGVVIVEAVIERTGAVNSVRILKGLPMGLDQAAIDAVKQWKFKPATQGGRPVDVYFILTVNFKVP